LSTLYIAEYASAPLDAKGRILPSFGYEEGAPVEQHVAISGSSTQSAAFNAQSRFIRVHTDAICAIAIGTNPTAVATAHRMPANATEVYGIVPGHKIAVIMAV